MDADTRSVLIGAWVKWGEKAWLSDENGRVVLPMDTSVAQAKDTLYIRLTGYNPVSMVPPLPLPTKMQVELTGIQQAEVTIEAGGMSKAQLEARADVTRVGLRELQRSPAADLYQTLGYQKGVDLVSSAMGFQIINFRGFNSTLPVRTLQLTDEADMQAPGLNFTLGTLLGTPDIDVERVDLIAGGSSLVFGPGAFNGVVHQVTQDPFLHQGLTLQVRGGERDLQDYSLRFAKAFQNRKGEPLVAFKLVAAFRSAYDWQARNMQTAYDTPNATDNPGGYDAVNRYGDENRLAGANDYTDTLGVLFRPGLGRFYRTGYEESQLVDYNTYSARIKSQLVFCLHREWKMDIQLQYGQGTTVFQGENRYSLKDFSFLQARLGVQSKRLNLLVYWNQDDAGKSYDAVTTAHLLQERSKRDEGFSADYDGYWALVIMPRIRTLTGYDPGQLGSIPPNERYDYVQQRLALVPSDSLSAWHAETRRWIDANRRIPNGGLTRPRDNPRLEPGTDAFRQAFASITRQPFRPEPDGTTPLTPADLGRGSRLITRSGMLHAQARYLIPIPWFRLQAGLSYRHFFPQTEGVLFSDTTGPSGQQRRIRMYEIGAYLEGGHSWLNERIGIHAGLRLDKNQNLPLVASGELSLFYAPVSTQRLRLFFSASVRNPTLADQYLLYDTGRATLLGNLNGVDSLVTLTSLFDYLATDDARKLRYVNLPRLRPETGQTLELGYRATFLKRLTLDLAIYANFYQRFIGYQFGAEPPLPGARLEVYRVAVNASTPVIATGAAIDLAWRFGRTFQLGANFTYAELSLRQSADTLVPAFNTPRFKLNVAFSGINQRWGKSRGWIYTLAFKWVDGYLYDGSPQFTGWVPGWTTLDLMLGKEWAEGRYRLQLACQNVIRRTYYTVYGGAMSGRMIHLTFRYHFPIVR